MEKGKPLSERRAKGKGRKDGSDTVAKRVNPSIRVNPVEGFVMYVV